MDLMPFLLRILEEMPETEFEQRKTQIALRMNGHLFAALSNVGSRAVSVAVFMDEELLSPRIKSMMQSPDNHFTHHIYVYEPEQIDEEMIGWLRRAAAWERG